MQISNILSPNCFFLALRLPFWFACVLAIVGVAWRTPLESVGLLAIFLLLLVAFEWGSRRISTTKSPVKKSLSDETDENVQQRITRSKTAEGLDRLDGTFVAEFPVDAMTATVHIPFCPAFESAPEVQVFPLDESDANIRISSIKPFGMRVDVKRSDAEIDRISFAVIVHDRSEPHSDS